MYTYIYLCIHIYIHEYIDMYKQTHTYDEVHTCDSIRDMIHLYAWHDSSISWEIMGLSPGPTTHLCVWLQWCVPFYLCVSLSTCARRHMCPDAFICVTWLVRAWYGALRRVTCIIHQMNTNRATSWVFYSSMCVPLDVCMTLYMCVKSRVYWFIHMCDMNCSCVT